MDHELVFDEGGNDFFDQHRLIPFIYSDVSDRVKFATEIEFRAWWNECSRWGN